MIAAGESALHEILGGPIAWTYKGETLELSANEITIYLSRVE